MHTDPSYMDLLEIRKLIVVAVASDDLLVEKLVLKGGNALELIHHIGERASLDLDFSLRDDFQDLKEIEERLLSALHNRFVLVGLEVFDLKFERRPRRPTEAGGTWGGYNAEFKLFPHNRFPELNGLAPEKVLPTKRNLALTSDGNQGRKFTIEISKYEFCEGAQLTQIDEYDCYVYSPAMIAAEKVRAVCQQMPGLRGKPTPRARDFYDIYAILDHDQKIDFSSESLQALVRHMFDAKSVPLELIGGIAAFREFHRQTWPAVQNAVRGRVEPFDFYFDFVVREVRKLEPLWIVDSPA